MPRKPRFYIPDVPVHIVQRGHSRDPVFFEEKDYLTYLDYLANSTKEYGCSIHAYVLMTNYIHILATPDSKQGISLIMQNIGRYYVPYINKTYGTSGSIWEGRYKSSLIHDEVYMLICMRYIELNPVRAGMVTRPSMYRWSSYRCNTTGKPDDLIKYNYLYEKLGGNEQRRTGGYLKIILMQMNTIKYTKRTRRVRLWGMIAFVKKLNVN